LITPLLKTTIKLPNQKTRKTHNSKTETLADFFGSGTDVVTALVTVGLE
jgi:hypothetical protein